MAKAGLTAGIAQNICAPTRDGAGANEVGAKLCFAMKVAAARAQARTPCRR
ncbi:hypothetical protein L861_04985 [Litchfieldella anticariensis FP35 = DSM 16096]|uniref:Uncharacterized protein n=1 Tax=Litchfieldella anticariensis (strain DSM 16096 / CECT 5854 / CIP 108499 / LMG 22089 / FP35) TaxID=1121939 RepID=S2L2Z9_LITA3|nr:hypothetical protein L861_04985 [Halomonas anticariensis FP35 = DSM 16096]